MMSTISAERNEIIVLNNQYDKFGEAVTYFLEVYKSDSITDRDKNDCLKYYGYAKSNFSNLSNGMDTNSYVTLIDLKDSTDYLISITDILLIKCEGNLTKEKKDIFEAKMEDLYKKATDSEDAFLNNAGELINKYKYDLEVYSTYTTQESQKKSQFWSQFFGVLAGSLASSIGNNESNQPSSFTVINPQTGQMQFCNVIAGILSCN
ncbi:MAG: hypothetical protein WD000_09565 [Thermodesulfobacteriota bacterium]